MGCGELEFLHELLQGFVKSSSCLWFYYQALTGEDVAYCPERGPGQISDPFAFAAGTLGANAVGLSVDAPWARGCCRPCRGSWAGAGSGAWPAAEVSQGVSASRIYDCFASHGDDWVSPLDETKLPIPVLILEQEACMPPKNLIVAYARVPLDCRF